LITNGFMDHYLQEEPDPRRTVLVDHGMTPACDLGHICSTNP
jgi:hypothetical protein